MLLKKIIYIASACFLLSACKGKKTEALLFETLSSEKTGLNFSNSLKASPDFNMLKYMYFYNGAGVGAGDFNNDGLVDLFFSSNQSQNKIFLNKGNLQFEDVTLAAKIPNDGGWSTGVSVADINSDGLLDIYICRVGNYETLKGKNQLLICKAVDQNGVPVYEDQAAKYGVDFSGFSTQAAFLDYDMDGDLDMYLMNHSLRYNSTFAPRSTYAGTTDSLSGDYFFRNDGLPIELPKGGWTGGFFDVSATTGINRSVIGYGLGIAVSDINLDGYPDLYIGNDFHENDYLYINNKKGGFTDELTNSMMHTSQFSMGVDIADINNDAYPEIVVLDMLPSDPEILKRSLGEDEYNVFNIKLRNGYSHQYARNTLQLNQRNGLFSEVGLYANMYATDWSWAALWIDFDNDGWKDLFISNGIPKRLNDIDYVNYISNDEIQSKIRANQINEKDMAVIEKFPQIRLPNRFFLNKGNAEFDDVGEAIQGNSNTFSNGAVYADFDNDGDLDVVVNNIDEPVLLYANKSNDKNEKPFLEINLKGPAQNVNALGAKLILFCGSEVRTYEKYPVRGFQSSMELRLHIGLSDTKVDSIKLIWPDNTCQPVLVLKDTSRVTITYQKGLPSFDYSMLTTRWPNSTVPLENIAKSAGLDYKHEENYFVEFDREQLIPFVLSKDGPALAIGDINGDKLDDIFIGSSKGFKSAVFEQRPSGKFVRSIQPQLYDDSTYEDIDACWADVNNDSYTDLIIASGGNEYYGKDAFMLPRVYLNNSKGKLLKKADAFTGIFITASSVAPYDFNSDGFVDLFIGGRAVPWEYGEIPPSYLLENDRKGGFKNVTGKMAKELSRVGLVKQAVWADVDNDKDSDLVLSLEWDGICAFINNNETFIKKYITQHKGWWNFTLPVDIDNDGDIDFIAGNQGLNSRLKATVTEPVRLYHGDFDGNGKREQLLTYYLAGREIPFANKAELEKQMPVLKKKFLYAEDFAKASLEELFGANELKKAKLHVADYFYNAVLVNDGWGNFTVQELPWQAQLTSYRDAVVMDANGDKLADIFMTGNFYGNNIQMGRNDASYGTILINKGEGKFEHSLLNGVTIKGEARHVRKIKIDDKREAFVVSRNNDSLLFIAPAIKK